MRWVSLWRYWLTFLIHPIGFNGKIVVKELPGVEYLFRFFYHVVKWVVLVEEIDSFAPMKVSDCGIGTKIK